MVLWSSYIQQNNTPEGGYGYTLVELLMVIAIIGILTSLVVMIPTQLRAMSTDQEREDDIASIARQLETAYDNQALSTPSYPSTVELQADITSHTRTMQGIQQDALIAPGQKNISVVYATTVLTTNPLGSPITDTMYIYQPITRAGALCMGSPSTSNPCVRFNLYYYSDLYKTVKKVTSIRQQ